MKTITKKYLEQELEEMRETNMIMVSAAGSNPFGQSIDLEKEAEDFLKTAEDRVNVQIWQKYRIKVLERLLEELE